jgi:thioredoxin-like negative regulator of GroEL
VGKINVDEQPELAAKHSISSIPTLAVYKDGKAVFQQSGALPKPGIDELVKKYI